MKTFNFDHEPTFAELWDVCVYNLLYEIAEYKKDIENLFLKLGISKTSKILDVSAGGGFPGIELIKDGYDIACVDGFDDEVALFNKKATEQGLDARCMQGYWKDLPNLLRGASFDFLFCRGNSFIYAGGGWNSMVEINKDSSMQDYDKTLQIFFDLLTPGGWLYIDKFKDDETSHREEVCKIKVADGEPESLIFWTERFPNKRVRQASMIRKKGETEVKVPNITYDLSSQELITSLQRCGFKNIEEIRLPSEKHFTAWIAQK